MTVAIVDIGPLYAAANAADPHHDRSLEALSRSDLQLLIPAFVTLLVWIWDRRTPYTMLGRSITISGMALGIFLLTYSISYHATSLCTRREACANGNDGAATASPININGPPDG